MTKDEEYTPKAMSLKIVNRMKYGGCSPMHQTFWLKGIANFYVFVTGTSFILSIVKLKFSSDPITFSSFMDDSFMIVAFLQICSKYYLASRQAKELLVMLDMVFDDFWPIENGLLNKGEEIKMRFLYRLADTVSLIYTCCAYFAIFFLALQAFLGHILFIKIWLPYEEIWLQHPFYYLMYIWQTFITYSSVYFSVIQVDSLFILFICFLFVQLKLLQKKITTISKENSSDENYCILKQCVEHHNLLIQFLHYLSDVYAKIFLPTFFTNYILFTLTIYGVIAEESINGKLKHLFAFVCIFGQLFAYCFGGQIIQDQGSEIAQIVYKLDWYKIRDLNLRKGLILIILRSNRPLELSVAGFLILDMRSLAMVIRACFSFIAFLTNFQ